MKTIGYKAMNPDMTCRGYQFEVGKTYTIYNDKPLVPCTGGGFHFCLNLEDVFNYYPLENCRVFEVETDSDVVTDEDKSITKTLTIKRELTQEDFNNYQFENIANKIYFCNYTDENLVKFQDYGGFYVRTIVASKIKNLDLMFHTFKNDDDWIVRGVVVERMKDLDLMFNTFKDDENYNVRRTVVKRMENLDLMLKTFQYDSHWAVRDAVMEKLNNQYKGDSK